MTAEEKHAVSHRGRAFRALAERLAGGAVVTPAVPCAPRPSGPAGRWSTWPPAHDRVRALVARGGAELTAAAERATAVAEARRAGVPDAYGGAYFGEGRDAAGDREGRSGYARYDRVASNADIAGWLLWRNFRVADRPRRRAAPRGTWSRCSASGGSTPRGATSASSPSTTPAPGRSATSGWPTSSPDCPGPTAPSTW